MATKLQRKVLWHLKNCGGIGVFVTGQKSTDFDKREKHTGAAIVRCSECVLWGLKHNHFIEKMTAQYSGSVEDRMYVIRPEGIKAAGLKEPEMRPSPIVRGHGTRWI